MVVILQRLIGNVYIVHVGEAGWLHNLYFSYILNSFLDYFFFLTNHFRTEIHVFLLWITIFWLTRAQTPKPARGLDDIAAIATALIHTAIALVKFSGVLFIFMLWELLKLVLTIKNERENIFPEQNKQKQESQGIIFGTENSQYKQSIRFAAEFGNQLYINIKI